jgi:hypothetical protein
MKKLLSSLFVILLCSGIVYYRKPIATFLYKNFIFKKEISVPEVTSYKKEYDFEFVQNTTNFYPKNKQEVLNVIYTVLNSGWDEFSFYCDDSYKECYDEINEIANDEELLGSINNFVHPYNTYEKISISINNFDKVTISIKHLYTSEDILKIDQEVTTIYNSLITSSLSDYEKIKKIHDYLINQTSYDQKKEKDENGNYKYKSNMAYGPLIYKKALCGGYTDAMALFLEKMNIPNYRVASENHIWNLVYINNEWKHLDLTWDDPVTSTGENILMNNFFLITTSTLKNLDKDQHNFNEDIYIEAK